MQFSLDRFYRLNRRALIWLALFGLIYILRDFFALIFLTFLLVSFTLPLINYLVRETRVPRTVIIVSLYLIILITLCGLITYIVPRITQEALSVREDLPQLRNRVDLARQQISNSNPSLKSAIDYVQQNLNWEKYVNKFNEEAGPYLTSIATKIVAGVTTLFLSLLFAFLIVLDLTRLRGEVRRLRSSRLHDFYDQSAGPVVNFAAIIARSFRAQAVIAVVNTILTLVGFILLGLPKVVLVSIIVFFFSFIPVLGVFISTIPAVLIALNSGGYVLALKVVGFIVIIHMIEAYVLNPLIYGQHLKLNPVLVLIILYVGHHFFGMWGMLLGVPVAYYFIHYVFKVPEDLDEPPDPPETLVPPGEEAARAETVPTEIPGPSPTGPGNI